MVRAMRTLPPMDIQVFKSISESVSETEFALL